MAHTEYIVIRSPEFLSGAAALYQLDRRQPGKTVASGLKEGPDNPVYQKVATGNFAAMVALADRLNAVPEVDEAGVIRRDLNTGGLIVNPAKVKAIDVLVQLEQLYLHSTEPAEFYEGIRQLLNAHRTTDLPPQGPPDD